MALRSILVSMIAEYARHNGVTPIYSRAHGRRHGRQAAASAGNRTLTAAASGPSRRVMAARSTSRRGAHVLGHRD
jgi:hypothetical protein